MIVFNGIVFGVLLAFLIGPVFFTLVQTSIEKGFKKAILVAIGVSTSDLCYILLAYFGVSQFLKVSGYHEIVAYVGGAVLIIFGVLSFFRAKKGIRITSKAIEAKGFFRFIIKGYLINGLSPFALVYWIGTMGLATSKYHYEGSNLIIFFGVIISVVLSTDILKAYLAGKLRTYFTPRLFRILNVTEGVVLCLFGLRMLTSDLF